MLLHKFHTLQHRLGDVLSDLLNTGICSVLHGHIIMFVGLLYNVILSLIIIYNYVCMHGQCTYVQHNIIGIIACINAYLYLCIVL